MTSSALEAGHDDERRDGIHGGGRRNLAGLLPADEPGAIPQDAGRERRWRQFRHSPRATSPPAAAEACFPGSAATVPRRIILVRPATSAAEAAGTAAAVGMAAGAAAINAEIREYQRASVI
jgi:hypothetical protein